MMLITSLETGYITIEFQFLTVSHVVKWIVTGSFTFTHWTLVHIWTGHLLSTIYMDWSLIFIYLYGHLFIIWTFVYYMDSGHLLF